jgi:hypothetical protein
MSATPEPGRTLQWWSYLQAVAWPALAVLMLEFWPSVATVWSWLALRAVMLLVGSTRRLGPRLLTLG